MHRCTENSRAHLLGLVREDLDSREKNGISTSTQALSNERVTQAEGCLGGWGLGKGHPGESVLLDSRLPPCLAGSILAGHTMTVPCHFARHGGERRCGLAVGLWATFFPQGTAVVGLQHPLLCWVPFSAMELPGLTAQLFHRGCRTKG